MSNQDSSPTLQAAAAAVADGPLLPEALENLKAMLATTGSEVARASIDELVADGAWGELNDRFFRTLAFGTGGLRGRTIGRRVTRAEQGDAADGERPQHPCVGTNAMNHFNLSRATQGLVRYIRHDLQQQGLDRKPLIVLAHDTRYFSRDFAEFCAKVARENGADVALYDSHRATPQMSFAVRELNADAGIMLTASHNPSHDNGYKVNYRDGAGIIEPHASGIIAEVNAIPGEQYEPLPVEQQGGLRELGADMDNAYLQRLRSVLLQPELLQQAAGLKIVFTALHGTGGVLIPRILRELGFEVATVPEQDTPDGAFPTVKSPNPENAAALEMALNLAEQTNADLVIGTDPDCDRMGVGVRDAGGRLVLLTGNQIGSLMAWYRVRTMFDLGILTESNRDRAVLVKTFVTTNLQRAIADRHGILCLDTLTGFKYISAKLEQYEQALPPEIRGRYRQLSEEESREARLKHSKFFVFGGEESYGYLGSDFVRDKDGNAAVIMFAEVAALAKSRGLSLPELLDQIYAEYGYYLEINQSKTFEGAEGAALIRRLIDSYAANPPTEADGAAVSRLRDFNKDEIFDEEGERIPREKMLMIELADGRSMAVRPSGTEPKVKYYMFAGITPPEGGFSPGQLADAKQQAAAGLDRLWQWMQDDTDRRLG